MITNCRTCEIAKVSCWLLAMVIVNVHLKQLTLCGWFFHFILHIYMKYGILVYALI